jgi:hypothetical protein
LLCWRAARVLQQPGGLRPTVGANSATYFFHRSLEVGSLCSSAYCLDGDTSSLPPTPLPHLAYCRRAVSPSRGAWPDAKAPTNTVLSVGYRIQRTARSISFALILHRAKRVSASAALLWSFVLRKPLQEHLFSISSLCCGPAVVFVGAMLDTPAVPFTEGVILRRSSASFIGAQLSCHRI